MNNLNVLEARSGIALYAANGRSAGYSLTVGPSGGAQRPQKDDVNLSQQSIALYQASLAAAPVPTYSVAQALKLAATASGNSLSISDTSANIQKSYDQLVQLNGKINAIKQTDLKAIGVTLAQFAAGVSTSDSLLYKVNAGDFKVAISGVDASNATLTAVASYDARVVSMTIADTSAAIASSLANIDALGSKVTAVSQTKKSPIELTYADSMKYSAVLKKIDKGSYTLTLSDNSQNIKTNLAAITKMGSQVSSIVQTDTASAITVNTKDLAANLATFKKINGGNFVAAIEDSGALIAKAWTSLAAISENISTMKIADSSPAMTLGAAQIKSGVGLLKKISNQTLDLALADSAGNISANLPSLLTLNERITRVTQTDKTNVAISYEQLNSDAVKIFLAKYGANSPNLSVSGVDKTNVVAVLADAKVKSVSLGVSDGTLNSTDANITAALKDARITSISVANANVASVSQLAADKRIKSIAIKDMADNLGSGSNLTSLDAVIKKNKGLITAINLDSQSHGMVTVDQNTYVKFAASVFAIKKNYALQVDFTSALGGLERPASDLRNAMKTVANSNGSFSVQVWDYSKGSFGKAVTLNAGVNFVKLGTVATYLDSGDANLNAILYGGTFKWQQNSAQSMANTSSYEIKPGVYSLENGSSKTTIKYKFLGTDASELGTNDKTGFAPMTEAQRSSVTSALNYISSLVNVKFELIDSGVADINFGTNDQKNVSGGYATGANPALGAVNLMLNNNAQTGKVNLAPSPGDYGWETVLHEIGHTLGLKHPGVYNAGGGKTDGPYLSTSLDNRRNTIMSYIDIKDSINWSDNGNGSYTATGVNPKTYMPLDVLALQFIYGKNESGVSLTDESKGLSNFQTTTFTSDWLGMELLSSTAKGLTIDASGENSSNIFDLRAGAFSSVNIKDSAYNAGIGGSKNSQSFFNFNNVALSYSSSVSCLIGGGGADLVYVSCNDVSVDGGAGMDKVFLYGSESDWSKTESNGEAIYSNGKVTAKIKNVEQIGYYNIDSAPLTHTRIDLAA